MAHVPNRFAEWGKTTLAGGEGPTAPDAPRPAHVLRSPRVIAALAVVGVGIGLALAVTLGGSNRAAARTTALNTGSFKTAYPDGFVLSVSHPVAGATVYQLTSPSSAAVSPFIHGPPPAGVIAVDITDASVALVESLDHDPEAAAQTPIQILPSIVSEPSGATGVVNLEPVHPTSLDGLAAAAVGYSYSYQGVWDVQLDVLARNGQEVEGIEMDADPALATQAKAALATILAHWSWTAAAASSSPHSSGGAVTS